jgi:S1-C subfamily serine protease
MVEDVVVAIDGQKVPDFDRLTAHVAQHQPGDKIVVEVLRGGEKRKLDVTLGSWAEYDKRRR